MRMLLTSIPHGAVCALCPGIVSPITMWHSATLPAQWLMAKSVLHYESSALHYSHALKSIADVNLWVQEGSYEIWVYENAYGSGYCISESTYVTASYTTTLWVDVAPIGYSAPTMTADLVTRFEITLDTKANPFMSSTRPHFVTQ